MKVVIHTQYYPPEMGAPQARLSELADRLVKKGHEVIVLTAFPNYPLGRLYPGYKGILKGDIRNGVKIFRTWIYPSKNIKLIYRLSNYFSFVFSSLLIGAAILPKTDYLLTESPPLFLGISGYVLSRLKKAKWIFNVSDLWPESAVRLGVVSKGLSLKLSERLEIFCYQKASLVTCQSQEILQSIKKKAPEAQIYHFSNGVDSSKFKPELRSVKLHDELGEGAECVAIYAGLHGIAQGLEQIIHAAKQLTDLERKLKIIFIGDGPEKESLIKEAKGLNIVKFLPPKPKEEIPKILASCDIALVPLKTYIPGAVPSKLYEAMASALPIILAAQGEAVNILNESQAGIAVTPGNVNEIAQAIRKLTLDGTLRKRLGMNGRIAVKEKFDRDKILSKFLNFMEAHLC